MFDFVLSSHLTSMMKVRKILFSPRKEQNEGKGEKYRILDGFFEVICVLRRGFTEDISAPESPTKNTIIPMYICIILGLLISERREEEFFL